MIPAFMLGVWSAILFAAACFTAARVFGQLRSPASVETTIAPVLEDLARAVLEEEAMEQISFDDYEEATAAKEAVLAEVVERNKEWTALAIAKFHELKHRLPEDFIGEDVRDLLIKEGGISHRAPAWGPLIGILLRGKQIEKTGTHRKMLSVGANARESRVYRLARQAVAA